MASHFYYHDVKWIKVYKNGDDYTPAVKFLVFRKYTRSFESLLNSLTLRLKPPFGAVRNLYIPYSGLRVRSLDDLKPNQSYVAAGNEKYRKLGYNGLNRMPEKARRRHSYMEVTPVIHSRIKVASRYKQELANLDAITIFVYRNGDDISPPRVVALTRKDMKTWDLALIRISERLLGNLTGCIQKLFTVEGRHLRNSRDLKNGEFYVGALVGETYRAVPYGLVASAASRKFSTWKSMRGEGDMAKLEDRPVRQDVGEGRSGGKTKSGRHTKKKSEEKKRQKGIFTASEEKPPTKIKEVDYDKDEGGVYRAKSQNTATMNASEINDNEDTAVELPVDAKAAEEIKDEEIMTLPLPQPKELQSTTLDDSTEMMSASQPCLEVEVDDKGDIQQISEESPLTESSAVDLSCSEVTDVSPIRQWTSRLPVYQAITRTASCGKQENKPRFELPFLWQNAKSEDYGNPSRHHSPSPSAASVEYLDHLRERTTTPSSLPDGMNSDTEDSAFKTDWYDSNYQTNVCIAAAASGNDTTTDRSGSVINSPTLSLGYEPKIPSPVSSEQDVSPYAPTWNPIVHPELTDKNCSGDAFAEDATPPILHYPYEYSPPLARRSLKSSSEVEIEKQSPRGGNLSYFTPRDLHSEYGPRPDSASSETSSLVSNRTFIGTAKNRRNSDNKRDNEEPLLPKVASADARTISRTESLNDYIPTHDKPFDPFYDTNPIWSNTPSPTRNRERLTPIENNVADQNNLSTTPRLKYSRERLRTSTSVDGERIRPIRSPALRASEGSTHNLLLVRDSGLFTKDSTNFDHSFFFTPRDSPRSKESSSVVLSFPTFGDERYREEAEAQLAPETKSPASKAASSSSTSTPRAHSSNSTKERGACKVTSPAFDPFAMFNEEVEKQDKVNAKCNIPILVSKGSETSRAKLQRLIKSAQISRQFERNLNTSIVRNHLTIQSDRLSCHDEGTGSAQPLEMPGSGVSWSKLSLPDIRKSPGGAEHLLGNADKIADFPSSEQHGRKEKNHASLDAVAESDQSQFSASENQQ